MRIVAGKLGGRRLPASPPRATRPTADRVREAIASALQARGAIEGAWVLDLFAGSGAVGLELLSRGARHVVAVDRNVRAVEQNAIALGVSKDLIAIRADLLSAQRAVAERVIARAPASFTLVFADPPYAELGELPPLLAGLRAGISRLATLAIEHRSSDPVPVFAGWALERGYRYGDSGIALLTPIA